MTLNWKHAVAIGAFLAVAPGVAGAHELTCDKTVNGEHYLELTEYPAMVEWKVRINNVHPTSPSVVESFYDALIPFDFDPAPPFAIPVGGYAETSFATTLGDYMQCIYIASLDGRVDKYIDNTARVTWDLGEAQCSARVSCEFSPPCEGPNCPCEGPNCPCEGPNCPCEGPNCPPPGGTTRTRGFYQTHLLAMSQCLAAGGPIVLGDLATISTLEDAMGIFWGSVPRFPDNSFRNQYERGRFQLAVQTLAGVCNARLFGATPDPANLIATALGLLEEPYSCTAAYRDEVSDAHDAMDDFNNSGDAGAFPPGFVPGPATPQTARDLAADPTTPDGICP